MFSNISPELLRVQRRRKKGKCRLKLALLNETEARDTDSAPRAPEDKFRRLLNFPEVRLSWVGGRESWVFCHFSISSEDNILESFSFLEANFLRRTGILRSFNSVESSDPQV